MIPPIVAVPVGSPLFPTGQDGPSAELAPESVAFQAALALVLLANQRLPVGDPATTVSAVDFALPGDASAEAPLMDGEADTMAPRDADSTGITPDGPPSRTPLFPPSDARAGAAVSAPRSTERSVPSPLDPPSSSRPEEVTQPIAVSAADPGGEGEAPAVVSPDQIGSSPPAMTRASAPPPLLVEPAAPSFAGMSWRAPSIGRRYPDDAMPTAEVAKDDGRPGGGRLVSEEGKVGAIGDRGRASPITGDGAPTVAEIAVRAPALHAAIVAVAAWHAVARAELTPEVQADSTERPTNSFTTSFSKAAAGKSGATIPDIATLVEPDLPVEVRQVEIGTDDFDPTARKEPPADGPLSEAEPLSEPLRLVVRPTPSGRSRAPVPVPPVSHETPAWQSAVAPPPLSPAAASPAPGDGATADVGATVALRNTGGATPPAGSGALDRATLRVTRDDGTQLTIRIVVRGDMVRATIMEPSGSVGEPAGLRLAELRSALERRGFQDIQLGVRPWPAAAVTTSDRLFSPSPDDRASADHQSPSRRQDDSGSNTHGRSSGRSRREQAR